LRRKRLVLDAQPCPAGLATKTHINLAAAAIIERQIYIGGGVERLARLCDI